MKKKTFKNIERVYYDSSSPGSLGSINTFAKNHPEFRLKDIKQFFKVDLATKTVFPRPKFSKKYMHHNISHYFSHRINVDITKFKGKIILIVGDTFSRYFSADLVKSMKSKDVLKCFKKIYNRDYKNYLPIPVQQQTTILVDSGSEWKSVFKKFCTKKHIHLQTIYNHSNFAEFLCRLLKNRLNLLLTRYGNNSFSKRIQDVCLSWNVTNNLLLHNVTPLAVKNKVPEALSAASMFKQYTWEQRLEHFEKSIALNKDLRRGVWVRLIRSARSKFEIKDRYQRRFEKATEPLTEPLTLYMVRSIRWPSIENKSDYPYVKLSNYNGEHIRGMFRTSDILISTKNPKKINFLGTVVKWKKEKNHYLVNFAGKNSSIFFFKIKFTRESVETTEKKEKCGNTLEI